jgi:hypothetical protein
MTRLCAVLVILVLPAAAGFRGSQLAGPPSRFGAASSPASRLRVEQASAAAELARLEHQYLRWPEDRDLFRQAARDAWSFVIRNTEPGTGLITPMANYPYATVWDLGSMLAAVYSARELGLLGEAAYVARVDRMLATLSRITLYDDRVFNKAYDTRSGNMAVRARGSAREWGWSTSDVGRLLVWLRIVGTDPRFAEAAEAVVRRNDFRDAIKEGYLWGEDLDDEGRPQSYQEGSIGYEQYAAQGFALWGYRAERALRLKENALPITVLDQPLAADFRRWDRLTSEPFLLWGLELGWDGQAAAFTRRLLLAQQARYRKTGFVTIAGEDAMSDPPHYFYYYCVYANGKDFAVEVQDRRAVTDEPRWISAKSAFAFHALMPGRYTVAALRALGPADGAGGWASGVYEATDMSTANVNVNTAAVILTAALVEEHGEPVLAHARQRVSE